jgi:putative ABC transport system permease protein
MRSLLHDLRYALRTLARAPGFTAVAVLSIALAIGANTAVFSLVYAVILKPLPFREPGRLIATWDTYLPLFPKLGLSPLELAALQQQTDLYEQTAWYRYVPTDLNLITPGAPGVELHATIVSTDLLPLLGVGPAVGRFFSAAEPAQSVLLSDALWKSRFAGSSSIVGQTIRMGDGAYTIAGVMPAAFQFPDGTDIWLPPGPLMGDELTNPLRHALGFVARLRPGVTERQAIMRTETIFRRLTANHPKTSTNFGVLIAGLQQDLTAGLRPTLLVLFGAVTLVLLIACGNVANLLLSRGSSRTREIAIRTAIGAGLGRIIRQLLTESLVLSALGGALGLALAGSSLAVISPVRAPIDLAVLAFLFAISVATGIIFGLAPVLQARRVDPVTAIKAGPGGGGQSLTARGAIVVLEFAFTLMVVIGAGILVRSFLSLLRVDPGFHAHNVLTLRVSSPAAPVFTRIQERLRSLPGVAYVAAVNTLPLIANRSAALRFTVPGSPFINPDALPVAQQRSISPDYFRAMGIEVRSGRPFTERDLDQPAVLINANLARRFWPGEDPVGKKFVVGPWGPNPNWATVVGVVSNVKQFGLDSDHTMDIYFPSLQPKFLVLRTTADPLPLIPAIQRELQAIDPALAIADVRTMDQILAQSASSRRWTTAILGVFAFMALALALVGIYAVTSWSVAQRTREIGIRMALGSSHGQVFRMILLHGVRLCTIGLVIGLAGAFALRRVIASLTFGVSSADPWVYAAATMLLVVAALLACYLPARRASRVAPVVALRWE